MPKKPTRPKRVRSKTRTVRARTPNGYIVFYKKYYKFLKLDNPRLPSQEIGRLMGKIWRDHLPYYLKNEFLKYAEVESQIKNFNTMVVPASSTSVLSFDRSYEELFEKYIQYPPYPPY
ncbi:hypothetical protein C1646_751773 [Rhizophagus diaphanus]|nr:hypothetical protein C1646_751773 [Rhizophagus diaphanus] [Rhizophagus sp. MUCL 43196]